MELPAFKKKFISLFFTSKKLQLLRLDKDKNRVVKFLTVDLPEGLIEKYKIKDTSKAAGIIKNACLASGLKEKSAGIVIPEFSTFAKTMLLPKLEIEELDEAVSWQFQDFWPSATDQMVMDWKIVGQQENNYQILSVATPQELLMSYVEAVGKAGLFPLVVETPSLSLSRISDGEKTPKLVVYANFDEVVLTIAKGEEILGSSVFKINDQQEIIWTITQMTKHYQQIDITRITVGGLQLTQQFISSIQTAIGKPVTWIQPKVYGLSASQIQEYLIPLSLQYKNPVEPSSEKTVNLLPPKWIDFYEKKKLKIEAWSLLLISSLVIWTCLLVAVGVYLNLLREINIYSQNPLQAVAIPKEGSQQIDKTNQLAEKVLKITQNSLLPQQVIAKINELKPQGVAFYSYKMDLDSGRIRIGGKAQDRLQLVTLKKRFDESEEFSQPEIPLSALEKEKDINFELTVIYGSPQKGIVKIPIK